MERNIACVGKPFHGLAYIPNTSHGLQTVSPMTSNVHTPMTINSNTAYLTYFKIRSTFCERTGRNGKCLPPSHSKSCIVPKKQIKPQKNRPQMAVTTNTAASSRILAPCSSKRKVPLNNDSQIFPRAEKILINKAGTKMNDTSCTAVRMIAIGGILFFFAVFSLLFSLFIPTLPFQ